MESAIFFSAVAAGETSIIEDIYRKNNAILSVKDASGRSALHEAVLHGQTRIVEQLLKYGIEPSATDIRGQTPLHLAAQRSSPAVLVALLQQGANWSIRDEDGKTPLFYAYENNLTEFLACFLKYTKEMQCGLTPEIILRAGASRRWTARPCLPTCP
ncbi:ankyrin repeat-containing domain protein [Penicillium macrosclerotiorum]|uniref:ankyrin repeat-containing domain protein n=1 Tax=Penicillium macrosclerotiorum TaxID=303699 RepID=UPI002548EAC7|nr:ankyrin repeat-containing domain protein [Penicillium macrosclerotiorum]KAJ5669112.1 ankyrin repeat-containing domain protein [Penicillium macrosclerotiorum]